MGLRTLQPSHWTPPKGYANGIAGRGTIVIVGGQVGWDERQQFESDEFVAQARRALQNIVAVLAEAGARPEHIVRMTWYVTNKREYLAAGRAIGAAFREIIGHWDIAMTAVEVTALMEDRAKVEIEVTAVVPG